jgi:GNAT superfamily N-acetyltransferase
VAALSRHRVVVRASEPGEGGRVAELWRQLWDAHDRWGGYAATSDPHVYAQIARRLDADAALRCGQPILGRHVHLIAEVEGRVVGQVEGWFDRQGSSPLTPFTCEVRSLIVHEAARGLGAGRALLAGLEESARTLARGSPVMLAAEVLEPNPALAFYAKVGYVPVAYCTRIVASETAEPRARYRARIAREEDARAIAHLESSLALRRRSQGDLRFDPPRPVDTRLVSSIAAHLAVSARRADGADLVVVDTQGCIRAAATFAVGLLEPPFVPLKRSMLGRFAVDPDARIVDAVAPLLAITRRLAAECTAPTTELTDLSAPGTPLFDATIALGGRPWSRVLCRSATRR